MLPKLDLCTGPNSTVIVCFYLDTGEVRLNAGFTRNMAISACTAQIFYSIYEKQIISSKWAVQKSPLATVIRQPRFPADSIFITVRSEAD